MTEADWKLKKRPTGIPGIDQLTHGGLPVGQATLVLGGTGTGKTILGLQILANAISGGCGGVYVTFEESPDQLRRNADSFTWGSKLTTWDNWAAIDARSTLDADVAGGFDIEGLLAAIGSLANHYDKPWIVLDGIDQLLQYQPESRLAIDQIRQLNEHCEKHGWTVLLMGKAGKEGLSPRHLDGVEFMLPTMLILTATVVNRQLNRFIRVAKYRGSGHVTDEVPIMMTDWGIQLPYVGTPTKQPAEASKERVSTGIKRLDEVLGGGLYRDSSLLISGRPGTAKSTLAASIAEAAAKRGERALLISFDEMENQYVRNLTSVGIRLQPHIDAKQVLFRGFYASELLLGHHLLRIQQLIDDFKPHCIVIDPVSALLKAPGIEGPQPAIDCLLKLTRAQGITTVLTSLIDDTDREGEATPVNVSTIADSWIVLDYNIHAGERNRALSIVKSRGTAHSNQQRELLLSDQGLELADVYEYGSSVLMGTARVQKESEEKAAARLEAVERERRKQTLEREIEQARNEMNRLETELGLVEHEYDEAERISIDHSMDVIRRRQPVDKKEGKDNE